MFFNFSSPLVKAAMGVPRFSLLPVILCVILAIGSSSFAASELAVNGSSPDIPGKADAQAIPAGCAVNLAAGPKRAQFPVKFIFGAATSAYQVEGAANIDGRGPSIWDAFSKIPGKIQDGSSGLVAADEYHKYPVDVALLKAMGMTAYRFSISWSRLLPDGVGRINPKGVLYYNRLINSLLRAGIKPVVTLYHWDLPNALHVKYGGWLNQQIVTDFAKYAVLCYRLYGDRVKTWVTINEPMQVAIQGYATGGMAPGRCSDRSKCAQGDSRTEPYIVGHNMLKAHGVAVKYYRAYFQVRQKGRIGITLDCTFNFPLTNSPADINAAERGNVFQYGWFADPIFYGRYPIVMKKLIGDRLPTFTPRQISFIYKSADFFGLNIYTAVYASPGSAPSFADQQPYADRQVATSSTDSKGNPIGAESSSSWLRVVPRSIFYMLLWIKRRYPKVPILITENGVSELNDPNKPLNKALCDTQRVAYYQAYLANVLLALQRGVRVQGYFAWSLVDNFEWGAGYTQRFGLYFVDFRLKTLPRYQKASAVWFSRFLRFY